MSYLQLRVMRRRKVEFNAPLMRNRSEEACSARANSGGLKDLVQRPALTLEHEAASGRWMVEDRKRGREVGLRWSVPGD